MAKGYGTLTMLNNTVRVDPEKCTQCGICNNICTPEAIDCGEVDDSYCFGCAKCIGLCPTKAISIVPREEPIPAPRIPDSEWNVPVIRDQVFDLVEKSRLDPDFHMCTCMKNSPMEVAAAIIVKGAKNLRDICRLTSTASRCGSHCRALVARMLAAAGIDPKEDDSKWCADHGSGAYANIYALSPEKVEELEAKYPEYRVKENVKRLNCGHELNNVNNPGIQPIPNPRIQVIKEEYAAKAN